MSGNMREMIDKVKSFKQFVNENTNKQSYYRIITNFEGSSIVFEPKGYYEATDDEGNPIMHTGDVWSRSNTPEISASKTVGGAVLGLWSMGYSQGFNIEAGYIYEINEKPQKDLSNLRIDDFEWLKEVRYVKPVKGIYVGKFIYTEQFDMSAINFYNRLTQDPNDEDDEIDVEDWDAFEKYILTIDKNELS